MFSKKMMILLTLLSSLQLMPAFNAVKKIGRGLRTGLLTTSTVVYGQMDGYNEEGVALHEAGHAVIAEMLNPGGVYSVNIDNSGGYVEAFSCNPKYVIMIGFAGYAQDLQDTKKLDRRHAMERELGLPLTTRSQDPNKQLEGMYKSLRSGYSDDMKLVFDNADALALKELGVSSFHTPDVIIALKEAGFINIAPRAIDNLTDQILPKAFQDTKKLVRENQNAIQAVGQALVEKKYLSGDEVRAIIAKTASSKE